ncbi:hypothetical protein K2X85_08765 [bacterium]|nr:hypothetical protein [bacterium]
MRQPVGTLVAVVPQRGDLGNVAQDVADDRSIKLGTLVNFSRRKYPGQVLHLVNLIFVILLVAMFFRFRLIASDAFFQDYRGLVALSRYSTTNLHSALATPSDSTPNSRLAFEMVLQPYVLQWLRTKPEHQSLNSKREVARTTVVEWLENAGVNANSISGKSGSGETPFICFDAALSDFYEARKSLGLQDPTVGNLLDVAIRYAKPRNVTVLEHVDKNSLGALPFSIAKGNFSISNPNEYKLVSLNVHEPTSLQAAFAPSFDVSQSEPSYKIFDIKVSSVVISMPLVDILGWEVIPTDLKVLLRDPSRIAKVRRSFGRLSIAAAVAAAENRMRANLEDVDMLGFSFIPAYFYIFVFLFLATVMIASIIHLVAPGMTEDDSNKSLFGVEYLLPFLWCRIAVWCMCPIAAMLFAFPGTEDWLEILLFCVTAVVLTALGFILVRLTSMNYKHERSGPA